MRRSFISCLWLLLGTGVLNAQSVQPKVQLNLQTGFERQDLSWSIAGNISGQNPNIYSELQWRKVGGQSVSAALQWNFYSKFALTADYSRTSIRSGTVTDNDYNGDNRTNPVYDELFDADKGYTRALSAGLGFVLVNNPRFSLTPYVGYGSNRQSLFILDRTGNFPDLNSTYEANWKGPFIKANAAATLSNKFKILADVRYTQANYNSIADWNLIQTFQHPISYRHTAKGYGVDANASIVYNFTQHIGINLGGGYFTWHTGTGVDELFLAAGGSDKTQLNGVDLSGYRLVGGLVLSY